MPRLITDEAAINAADIADYTRFVVEDVKSVTDEVVKELKELPSAQPEVNGEAVKDYCRKRCLTILTDECFHKLTSAQPERKGRWIIDKGLYRCTSCNQLWTEWWAAAKPIERMNKDVPYCPMCGSHNGV